MNARRCVILERATELEELIAEYGTKAQAEFVMGTRDVDFDDIERRHQDAQAARDTVVASIPADWKRVMLNRRDLDRFLFFDDDIVVALGQDGLVANLARYLDGQQVIGVNNAPDLIPGVLTKHEPAACADLMADAAAGRLALSHRTMVAADLDDGQRCLGLNEVFFGHAGHQSAKYVLSADGETEDQSSSGLLVATGTGATGWAASLNLERGEPLALPDPFERKLAWFVREAWPSRYTGSDLVHGYAGGDATVAAVCKLGEGAVLFSDGIEADSVKVAYGQRISFGIAERTLNTVE
jgi:hypothetical protein